MDLARKLRIGIGSGIILIGLILHSSWWVIGIFPLITGIFNTCPTCSTSDGDSCKVEPSRDKPDQN
jgi:hypothetical protein